MLPKYKPSQEAIDKKAFDEEMNKTAERVVELIPGLLADIIDGEAERLAELVPEVLRKDSITHDVMNEKYIRRMLAGKIGNKLGHGIGFLQK
ncbi:hypothetical protein VPS56_000166 [Escherichia coli]|nr:hypothetical protein [Escherichia coli]